MENIDMIFLFVIATLVGYYMCKNESFEGFGLVEDIRKEVNNIYNADTEAIKNLSNVATKLQSGGYTIPGNITTEQVILSNQELNGPTDKTRINGQGIIFGSANNGREGNSAQISAGRHDADSLCIVGMSKPDGSSRRITMWAEGGAKIIGPLTTDSSLISPNANVSEYVNTPSLRRVGGDWLRINDSGNGRVALYGGLAINDTNNGNSGLSVGEWNDKVGQGNILATGNITARGNINTDNGIINFAHGWRIFTDQHSFRIQKDNVDKLVAHYDGLPVYAPNGMDVGIWTGIGQGSLNVKGDVTISGKDKENVPVRFGNYTMLGQGDYVHFQKNGKRVQLAYCGGNAGWCP